MCSDEMTSLWNLCLELSSREINIMRYIHFLSVSLRNITFCNKILLQKDSAPKIDTRYYKYCSNNFNTGSKMKLCVCGVCVLVCMCACL